VTPTFKKGGRKRGKKKERKSTTAAWGVVGARSMGKVLNAKTPKNNFKRKWKEVKLGGSAARALTAFQGRANENLDAGEK